MERHLAKLDVLHLPSAIRKFSRLPAQLENRYRLKLEIQRGCEAVEVPGLSTKALAAITSLHQVGVSTTVSVQDRPVEELSSSEIRQAARVAPAWNAIPRWVRAELAVFREAANVRLGSYPDVSGNEALSKIHGLSRIGTLRRIAVETFRRRGPVALTLISLKARSIVAGLMVSNC
jgi:hypothetical protein